MPADPTPAPEWAASACLPIYLAAREGAPPKTILEIAGVVVASVRDAALREAAEMSWLHRDAILALVGTAPKESPRG